MYESPIELIEQTMSSEISQKIDEMVISEVHRVDCNVNKEELLKALQYDRDQWHKGFNEGYQQGRADALSESIKRINEADYCNHCGHEAPRCSYFCKENEFNEYAIVTMLLGMLNGEIKEQKNEIRL